MTAPSLNEVARRIKAAALGRGWPLGIAGDIGEAVAWLCANDLDGVAAALTAIEAEPGQVEARLCDRAEGWRLGPVAAAGGGPSALDLALAEDAPVTLELSDSGAMLILGLAGWAALQTGAAIVLTGAVAARIEAGRLIGDVETEAGATWVGLRVVPGQSAAAGWTGLRREVRAEDWEAAGALAARMLVPATAASRAFGAGAGESDGD